MKRQKIYGSTDNDYITGALDVLLPNQVGSGGSRNVFSILESPYVLKLEWTPQLVQNVIEYELWKQWEDTEEGKKWLAPCIDISRNGRALVQEALEIFTDLKDPRLPETIPRFMTDTKVSNWGVDKDGNVKCCDYGVNLLMQGNPWRLVKPQWWSLSDD